MPKNLCSIGRITIFLLILHSFVMSKAVGQNPFFNVFNVQDGSSPTQEFGVGLACLKSFRAAGNFDIAIGSPGATGGGRLDIFTPTDLSSAVATLAGSASRRVGASVAYIGDVNSDGLSDIIVGAPSDGLSPFLPGQVFVFNGPGTSGFSYIDMQSGSELGFSVTGIFGSAIGAGGQFDFATGAPTTGSGGEVTFLDASISGGPPVFSVANPMELAGYSIDSVADRDSDGVRDLIIGAPGANNGNGIVYLVSTQDQSPLDTIFGPVGGSLGASVASVGDLESDGDEEFVAGAPASLSSTGQAFLYSSVGADGPDLLCTIDGPAAGSFFGSAVAAIGDINADGRAEFAISAPGLNSGQGAVFVYSYDGSTCSLLTTNTGTSANEKFGTTLAGRISPSEICDFNSDSLPDLIVGSELSDQSGRVTLLAMNFLPTPTPTPTATPTPSGPTSARLTYRLSENGAFEGRLTLDQDPPQGCTHSIFGRYSRADLSEAGPVNTVLTARPLTERVSRYRASSLRKARCASDRKPYSYHLIARVDCGSEPLYSNVFARQTNCGLSPAVDIEAWERQLQTLPLRVRRKRHGSRIR